MRGRAFVDEAESGKTSDRPEFRELSPKAHFTGLEPVFKR